MSELSTGTRRIVELGALIALDTKLMLLDEPTAGVAQRETEAFGPLIQTIREELGAAILIIEHDMPMVMSISDRIYCLEAGRRDRRGRACGGARDDPAVIASYLGTDERTQCTKLTEDEQVFAVIGSLQASAVECYVTQHETALVGGQQTDDLLAVAVAPWFAFTAPIDRLALKTIEGAAAEGVFDGKKVGVITLPLYEPMMESSVNPALDAAGVDVVETAVIDVPDGDAAAATAAAATILEKFRAEDVELVVTVGDAFLNTNTALEQTDYRPQIVATDANPVVTALVGRTDFSAFQGLIAGSTPSKAVQWGDPAMQECVDVIRSAQPDRQITDPLNQAEGERDTFVSVVTACQSVALFRAIAEAAGPGLNNDTFRAAGESLGEFTVPGNGGVQNYTADALSGDPAVFLGRFDPSTNTLEPDAEPVP
jgi:energy-coupling factor transporter ATP-binding protein EcfA2